MTVTDFKRFRVILARKNAFMCILKSILSPSKLNQSGKAWSEVCFLQNIFPKWESRLKSTGYVRREARKQVDRLVGGGEEVERGKESQKLINRQSHKLIHYEPSSLAQLSAPSPIFSPFVPFALWLSRVLSRHVNDWSRLRLYSYIIRGGDESVDLSGKLRNV